MLELLDKLDDKYNRINNLGRWTKHADPRVLALTATISTLQSQLLIVKGEYGSLQALVAKSVLPTPNPNGTKLQKPPPKKSGDPEITEIQDFTWKWCDEYFNGTWNCKHVTAEHFAGVSKRKCCKSDPSNDASNNNNKNGGNAPQGHLSQTSETPPDETTPPPPLAEANIAASSSSILDFYVGLKIIIMLLFRPLLSLLYCITSFIMPSTTATKSSRTFILPPLLHVRFQTGYYSDCILVYEWFYSIYHQYVLSHNASSTNVTRFHHPQNIKHHFHPISLHHLLFFIYIQMNLTLVLGVNHNTIPFSSLGIISSLI